MFSVPEPLPVNDCTKTLYRECSTKFTREMGASPDICQSADDTLSCFEKKRHTCNSALLDVYIKVLEKHSKHLTHIAEENKEHVELCSA